MMPKGMKIVFGILFSFLLIFVFVFFHTYRMMTGSLPKREGEIVLKGLKEDVHIYRDVYSVPHIFADNEEDLFFAAGYTAAQDRLWQMDMARRACRGRLSEILGDATIEIDKLLLTLGFERTAQAIEPTIHPESRKIFEAYTNGINEFIESHRDNLPMEFILLNYQPDPWEVMDCIAYGRLMAWELNIAWKVDLTFGKLINKFGARRAREVFPNDTKYQPMILPKGLKTFSGIDNLLEIDDKLKTLLQMDGSHVGSNNWVVSGERSTTGKPILANDPHLGLPAPSKWYEMHLKGGEFDVAGVTLAGVPGIIIGHNANIAWGLTNVMMDDSDFYVEKINPGNSNQYRYKGKWEDMKILTQNILVKDQKDTIKFEIRMTHRGPIISDFHDITKNSADVISIRWTGHDIGDEGYAFYKINQASNWEEFADGISYFTAPAQNFIYADVNGNIGYYLGGKIPIRRRGTGIVPVPGETDSYEWKSYVPFAKQPHFTNPEEGFIATANNKTIDNNYPYHISNLWEPPSRIQRIRTLLKEKQRLSSNDFKIMQTDVISPHAKSIMPYLLQQLEKMKNEDEKWAAVYNMMKTWDYSMRKEKPEPTIFNIFFINLIRNIYLDEMGDTLFKNYVQLANIPIRNVPQLLKRPRSTWFDDKNTIKIESRRDILRKSIQDAITYLTENADDSFENWAWGNFHTLTFEHFLASQKPLDKIFNIGPFPSDGSGTTVNNGEFKFYQPYRQVLGPSFRQIIDMSKPSEALTVITTGQSGHRLSEHYEDQTSLWRNGFYKTVLMDRQQIESQDHYHLVLKRSENK